MKPTVLDNHSSYKGSIEQEERMEMKFKPEDVVFHREEYQALLAEMRPMDYRPLLKKELLGRVNLRHRRPNSCAKKGKALVSFLVAQKGIKSDIRKAVDIIGGFGKSLSPQDRILL